MKFKDILIKIKCSFGERIKFVLPKWCLNLIKNKTTLWKTKVGISNQIYENSWPVMYVLRVIGLFPLEVIQNQSGLFLRLSPWYEFYSYGLGLIIIAGVYYHQYEDLFVVKEEVKHIGNNTDKLLLFTFLMAYSVIVFYQICVMPSKVLQFFKYLKYCQEVDSRINIIHSKYEMYKAVFVLIMLLVYTMFIGTYDLYVKYSKNPSDFIKLAIWNYVHSAIFSISIAIHFMNQYIAEQMEKRIIRLNTILELQSLNFGANTRVTELTNIYLKLIQATSILNYLLGFNNVLGIVAALCRLVASKYFIVLALEDKGKDLKKLFFWIFVFSIQTIKLLFIIEPWYAYGLQLETLKRQVCKLMSLNINRHNRKQLATFAMILCLRQFKFSACGLFSIDRLLYPTIIGTTVTLLAVSLQAQQRDI